MYSGKNVSQKVIFDCTDQHTGLHCTHGCRLMKERNGIWHANQSYKIWGFIWITMGEKETNKKITLFCINLFPGSTNSQIRIMIHAAGFGSKILHIDIHYLYLFLNTPLFLWSHINNLPWTVQNSEKLLRCSDMFSPSIQAAAEGHLSLVSGQTLSGSDCCSLHDSPWMVSYE